MSNLGMGVMIHMLSGSGSRKTGAAVAATEGKKIVSIKLLPVEHSDDEDHYAIEIEVEDGTKVHFWDAGQSCCESRYITTDADLPSYVGKKIIEYELRELPCDGTDWEQHDRQAFVIRTDEGNIDFVTHVEHNGYYGGFAVEGAVVSSPAVEEQDSEEVH